MAEDNANETVKIEVPRQYIQIILEALDVTNRQQGLRSAEALLVVAKELTKQTGEQPPAPAPAPAEAPAEPTEETTE